MYKIIIVSDSNKHFEVPILEYLKRLWKYVEIIKIKPEKNWEKNHIIGKETRKILDKIEKTKWFKIVLNPIWKNLNTEKFYELLELKKQNYWNIVFIIGWANGLDYDKLKAYIDLNLNLWEMTLPHSLALLVLLEQIYRSEMIKKWTDYNK